MEYCHCYLDSDSELREVRMLATVLLRVNDAALCVAAATAGLTLHAHNIHVDSRNCRRRGLASSRGHRNVAMDWPVYSSHWFNCNYPA